MNSLSQRDIVDDGDFVAVYDKQMLDRAKSYIESGSNTIRDRTPWNSNNNCTDSVAYGWGCWDSVEEYNNKMTLNRQLFLH